METSARRRFQPFRTVVLPVGQDGLPECALSMGEALGVGVRLVGMISVPVGESLSTRAGLAREMRKRLEEAVHQRHGLKALPSKVIVSHNPLWDLRGMLSEEGADLLVLEWPYHFDAWGERLAGFLEHPPCDTTILRGPWPRELSRVFVPVRGGPTAGLALRLGLSLPHRKLNVLNLSSPDSADRVEDAFRGLSLILPSLSDVDYRRQTAASPVEVILKESGQSDLLIVGASAASRGSASGLGEIPEKLFAEAPCATLVVKRKGEAPRTWSGLEGTLSGAEAISVLVDRWFAENTYHGDEFDDLGYLLSLKREQGLTVSLALPALNEEATVGEVIRTVKEALADSVPLLDEILLMDSNSQDRTREIAEGLGVPVFIHQKVLESYGPRTGKGEALWKSLYVTHGDIILWIDTDIVNIHPRFVYGVLGPLLRDPRLLLVKGFYQRPLRTAEGLQPGGGGRVTELTARPLINLFYPQLSGIIQPLAGEYGGRREALERVHFFSGYGVEIGLLIEIFEKFGLSAIAQVDLLERVHHNQGLEALSKMSFQIMQAVFRRLEDRFGRPMLEEVNKTMKLIRSEGQNYYLEVEEVAERERPPMIELPEYRQLHPASERQAVADNS